MCLGTRCSKKPPSVPMICDDGNPGALSATILHHIRLSRVGLAVHSTPEISLTSSGAPNSGESRPQICNVVPEISVSRFITLFPYPLRWEAFTGFAALPSFLDETCSSHCRCRLFSCCSVLRPNCCVRIACFHFRLGPVQRIISS